MDLLYEFIHILNYIHFSNCLYFIKFLIIIVHKKRYISIEKILQLNFFLMKGYILNRCIKNYNYIFNIFSFRLISN